MIGFTDLLKNKLGLNQAPAKEDRLPAIHPGASLAIEATPFLLGGDALSFDPPPPEVVVLAVSRVEAGHLNWERIHFKEGFIQLDFSPNGDVGECRFFTHFDEILPQNQDEWAFWLDDADGYIGYPSFETPNGQSYHRHWVPGHARINPVEMKERVLRAQSGNLRSIEHSSMLYVRETGIEEPSHEYLLISAERDAGQALIALYVGIDLSPSSLKFL